MKDSVERPTAEALGEQLAGLIEIADAGIDVAEDIEACVKELLAAECHSTADSVALLAVARFTLEQIEINPAMNLRPARLLAGAGRQLLDRALAYTSGEALDSSCRGGGALYETLH